MKTCIRCGYAITGKPVEIVPFSSSGAKPTTHRHATDAECNEATLARRETATYTSPVQRHIGT